MTEEKITQLYDTVSDSVTFLQNLQSQTNTMHKSMYALILCFSLEIKLTRY